MASRLIVIHLRIQTLMAGHVEINLMHGRVELQQFVRALCGIGHLGQQPCFPGVALGQ